MYYSSTSVRAVSNTILNKIGLARFGSKATNRKFSVVYASCSGFPQSVIIITSLIIKSISTVLSNVMLDHSPRGIYISRPRITCFKPTSRLPPNSSPRSCHLHKSNIGIPVLHHNTPERCRKA